MILSGRKKNFPTLNYKNMGAGCHHGDGAHAVKFSVFWNVALKGATIMNKKSAKFGRFLPAGLFVLSLLAISSCMMPELSPELYVGTLNLEADTVNINSSGAEYLKLKNAPNPVYYIGGDADWDKDGLEIVLVNKENTEIPVNLAECTFAYAPALSSFTDRGKSTVTVSYKGKNVAFPIAVLKPGNPANTLLIMQEPAKTFYSLHEAADWRGLKAVGIHYDGTNLNKNDYVYPATIANGDLTGFDSSLPGSKTITLTKPEGTATFIIEIVKVKLYKPDGSVAFYKTIEEAASAINSGTGVDYRIELYDDFLLAEGNIIFRNNTIVTLDGNATERKVTAPINSPCFFNVNSSTTFTLGNNIILDGRTIRDDNHKSAIYVNSGARFNMLPGSIIANNRSWDNGGAVHVAGGTFTMSGGIIRNNEAITDEAADDPYHYGGGVYLGPGSIFTMSGNSIIMSNDASEGGGVYVYGGEFFLENGSITGNTASDDEEGGGGGVHVTSDIEEGIASEFTMSGGIISGNSAGGEESNGGGVLVTEGSKMTMAGGTIQTNYCGEYGGGVCVINGSTFIKKSWSNPALGKGILGNEYGEALANHTYYDEYGNTLYLGEDNRVFNIISGDSAPSWSYDYTIRDDTVTPEEAFDYLPED
jgi:hypothetical protein